MRRTKIIATLGPATDQPGMLEKLLVAGVDVFRLNYSHQTHVEHEKRMKEIRRLSQQHKHAVAVIADLQGPKIRIERFKDGKVQLREGAKFNINTELGSDDGDETQVGVSYKKLSTDVKAGDKLMVDDGRVVLEVDSVDKHIINCEVITGGVLSNNKGINLQGGGLSAKRRYRKRYRRHEACDQGKGRLYCDLFSKRCRRYQTSAQNDGGMRL